MTRKTHEQLVKAALTKPSVKREYDALEKEIHFLNESLKAKHKKRLNKKSNNPPQLPML